MRQVFTTIAVAGLCLGITAGARADLKVTMKMGSPEMEAKMPNMANMPPQIRQMIEGMMTTTVYMKGTKSRTDHGFISVIIDRPADKMITVNNTQRIYSITKIDEAKVGSMATRGQGGALDDISITPGTGTKTILGHECHEYILKAKMKSSSADGPTAISDDMYIATDLGLSAPPAALGMAAAAAMRVPGYPLETTVTMIGGKHDGMTMTLNVTDLSTDTIPGSMFEIPDGYTQSSSPVEMMGGMPGMGGMGRGGGNPFGGGAPGQ